MRNIFLRLTSLFIILNLLFYSIYPAAVVLAQDEYFQEDESGGEDQGGEDEGGGDEGSGDYSADYSDWDSYSYDIPEAETQEPFDAVYPEQGRGAQGGPEIPQESFDFAQDQQPPISTQGGPFKAPGLSYILPPEEQTPASEVLETEQQQQVAYYDDLLTSEEQDELTSWAKEDYEEQINQEPVVDDESQNSALSSYFASAQSAADREDQEYARERGLPDADAQSVIHTLVSTLEKGQDVPDEFWQDYGSKLGDLADGAADLVTSQVREAQERGEQAKAQEELAKAEAAAAQQQEKVAQALDQWSGMSALERAETLREYYNLPPGTDPEQVLSFADKAMTLGGVEFRSGPQASTVGPYGVHLNTDLSSFIITDTKGSVNEYLSVLTPDLVGIVQGAIETGKDLYELYQSMPPEKAVEVYFSLSPEARDKVNQAMLNGTKEIAGAAAQMVPFLGTNILSERVNGLNSNMAQIAEKLKDPNLTEEEREVLKQEYFFSLNEVQDVKKDLAINAAFDLVGGVPGSALAERAAGKGSLAAKELFLDTKAALDAAKQVGKEGLDRVWVGGRQLAADERGSWDVFGLLSKEEIPPPFQTLVKEKIDSSLVGSLNREFDITSALNAQSIRSGGEGVSHSGYQQIADVIAEATFGVKDPEVVHRITVMMLYDHSPEKIIDALKQSDHFLAEFYEKVAFSHPPHKNSSREAGKTWESLKYEAKSLLGAISNDGLHPPVLDPGQSVESFLRERRVQVADAILSREKNLVRIEELVEEGKGPIDDFLKREIANGADPASLSSVNKVIDSNKMHLVSGRDWPRDPDLKDAAGITYHDADYNIAIRQGIGEQFGVTCHEACHRAAKLKSPDYVHKLDELFGVKNAAKITEGGAEHFARKVAAQSGKENFGAYPSQVEMMKQIENELVNAGVSPAKASAMMTEGEWGGKWGKVVKTLGQGRMKEILDATPAVVKSTEAERFISGGDIDLAREQTERELLAISRANQQRSFNLSERNKLSFLVKNAYAQSDTQNGVANSDIFESLVRKKLAKNILRETGDIDSQTIKDILETDMLSQPPRQIDGGYELVTGKSGTTEENFGVGQYIVNIDQLQNFNIKTPSFVEVKAGTAIIAIGIREGSGKVEKTSGIRNVGGPFDVYAQDKSFDTSTSLSAQDGQGPELPKVQVAAFYDENGNGNWDGSEKALPWAGIKVSLTKVNQEKFVSMLPGWNLITLTALPTTPLTASSLLGQIAKQGGYATTVSKLEGGSWKSYVIRGDNTFSGDDFPIVPGEAYFVKNLKRALLTFEGQEFAAPVKVNMEDGWNAVGFPKTAGPYTVSTLIDELNTQQAGADAASRWESGLWDSFVKKGESYGENFAIEPNRGYIVRLKKGVELTP